MTFKNFHDSLHAAQPPAGATPALAALWWDAKGDWQRAHSTVDDKEDQASMWVHAYLHRKEGVERNASYWYEHAGKPFSQLSLEEESRTILEALLGEESERLVG